MTTKAAFLYLRWITMAIAIVGALLLSFKVLEQSTLPFAAVMLPFLLLIVTEWAVVGRTFVPGRRSMVVRADGAVYWYVGTLYSLVLLLDIWILVFPRGT